MVLRAFEFTPRRKFFDTGADNRRMSIHPLLQRGRQMAVPRRGAATGKNCITLRSMAGGFADATFLEADLNEPLPRRTLRVSLPNLTGRQ